MITILCALALSPGSYRVVERDGRSWWVGPDQKPFWSMGVDCTDLGIEPAKWDAKNPGYSALRLYPSEKHWVDNTLENFAHWGVNSLGAWSDTDPFTKYAGNQRLPHFECLHLASYNKAPYNDLFEQATIDEIDKAAKSQIAKLGKDPYVAGYFTDNELGWWDVYLFQSYLKFDPKAAGRQRLQKFIRSRYKGRFSAFTKDWITPAKSFEEFEKAPVLYIRPGGGGVRVIRAWMGEMGRYYYKLVHDAVRKYDKTRPILGDRYLQFYVPEIAAASKPYLDVASTNYGADWNDGTLTHFFLDTLHELTGKPVQITEFYMTAMENRSGNKNSSGGFPIVQTQAQRAAAFKQNLIELASRPYVVGAHWFQYYDEPAAGRGDGEDYNMGLVDTQGRPYEGMVAALKAARLEKTHAASISAASGETASIPPAPSAPLKGLKEWPRKKAFVPAASPAPVGDLYVTWDKGNLYLATIVMDYVEESLYEGGRLPPEDQASWRISIPGRKAVTVRFMGSKQIATCDDPSVELHDEDGLKHTVLVAIPMPKALKTGDLIILRSNLTTHGRADQIRWNTTLRLTDTGAR